MAEAGLVSGELLKLAADLFAYAPEEEKFELRIANAQVYLTAEPATEAQRGYFLRLLKPDGKEVLHQRIADDMRHQFFAKELSFVWVLIIDAGGDENEKEEEEGQNAAPFSQCFSLKFQSAGDFVQMRNQFSVCLFESKLDFGSLSLEDKEWVQGVEKDDMEVDTASESEKENEGESAYTRLGEAKSGVRVGGRRESDDEDEEDASAANSQLAVAYNNDRAFVVRGKRMGVFKSGEEGLDYQAMLKFQTPQKGSKNAFSPSQILLHQQDQSMLILDPSNPHAVMRMDLERGAIVDEWKDLSSSVNNLARAEKYANLTVNPEFLALNENSLMRMDPRTKELMVQSKTYAKGTRAKLSHMATTGTGYVAVASQNGDIRLFDQIGKNAKTHLPGLGVPIKGIDVTEDGSFVLATTKDFLLLVDTRVQGEAKGGFLKSMGNKKPPPLRLALKPEDVVKHRINNVDFTPAHFNTGTSMEKSIVTSTGPFVVVWNLRQVKQGNRNAYYIRRYRDNVVADEFEYNNDGKIIVTLPNDVTLNAMQR